MISRDEAQRIAESSIGAGEGSEVSLYEFEHGYVAALIEPEPEDSDRPPSNVGGGRIVIDKESGEVTSWPSISARMIAERYSAKRRGGQ